MAQEWKKLDKGAYGDEMVKFQGKWYAIYDKLPARQLGEAGFCFQYYRHDYSEEGVSEARLIVNEKHEAKWD